MKKTLLPISAACMFATVASHAATLVSVQTGSFNQASTWTGGPPSTPTGSDNFTVSGGNTVTAGSGDVLVGVGTRTITSDGTFVVGAGSSFTNYSSVTRTVGSGTVNVTGGVLSAASLGSSTATGMVFNVTSGSLVLTSSSPAALAGTPVFNVSGGTFAAARNTSAMVVNLSSGGVVDWTTNFNVGSALASWNGGTNITNTSSASGLAATGYLDRLDDNAGNVWQLSSKTTKQTFTVTTNNVNTTSTQGTIAFNIYSGATNDSDLISLNGTTSKMTLTSGVHLDINGLNLTGLTTDYLGESYKLFSFTGAYTGLAPTIDPAVWNINGTDYNVTFTNNLAIDGTIIVAGLTAVPEPSAAAMVAIGALSFCAVFRRRHSR